MTCSDSDAFAGRLGRGLRGSTAYDTPTERDRGLIARTHRGFGLPGPACRHYDVTQSEPPPSRSLMANPSNHRVQAEAAPATRREERRSFLFFTIAMAPVLAVLLVAGYGFVVWMLQLIAGPPGS